MKKRNNEGEKQKSFLKKQYSKAFNYLFEIKSFLKIIIYLFIFFALIGFFVPMPEWVNERIILELKKLLSQTEGFVFIDWFKFIFFNNIKSSFLSLVGGIFFGAIPLFATIVNGFLIGFVSNLSVSAEGVISLWKLVPHGIFEIPAIFISFACGLRFGTFVFQKDIKKSFQNYFIGGMRVFFLIVLPLLIVAGIIESALIFFGN